MKIAALLTAAALAFGSALAASSSRSYDSHATERLPGNHANQAARDASRSDTRGMGAAGSDDSGRRRRIDDAYDNCHARQK